MMAIAGYLGGGAGNPCLDALLELLGAGRSTG
jgi:hypothetical protein